MIAEYDVKFIGLAAAHGLRERGYRVFATARKPPDVDALLFTSPTPFSAWGVIAMWAVFAAALLAANRKRLPLRTWRLGHTLLVSGAVLGSVVHALLIEGTMEFFSKAALCALVLLATARAVTGLRSWAGRKRRNAPDQRPQS